MAEIAGLTLITPSSVAGSGVSLSGAKVVFTAATSASVNGVFDSTYDNYLIVWRGIGSTSTLNIRCRLRASGSDATGINYVFQQLSANGTTVAGSRPAAQNVAEFTLTGTTTLREGFHLYTYGPNLAQPTAFRSVTVSAYNSASIVDYACTHSLSTSYDGFTMFPSSGNMTGALTIYGLSQ